MSLSKRLFWLLVILLVQASYFPINRAMEGGIALHTPLDSWIPLWPVWAVPYLLSIVWWEACLAWAAWKMPAPLFRTLVVGALTTLLTSYIFYVLCPTYVARSPVEGSGWPSVLVRLIYDHDRLNNAFPSGHTYTTVLIILFWWHWQPRLRWPWVLIGVIVLLSTLFTGQHNVLDLVGGVVWAWMGYFAGRLWDKCRGGD